MAVLIVADHDNASVRSATLNVVTAAGKLGGGAAVLLLDDEAPSPAKGRPSATAKPRSVAPAVAYDFDGDGHRELVLGMPGSGKDRAGAVVVRDGDQRQVIGPKDAGLGPPYDSDVEFGRNIASGDFNGDGRADLAMSSSGRDAVSRVRIMAA